MLLRSTLAQKRLGPQDHVFLCTRYVRPISGCNWCTFCVGLIDVASSIEVLEKARKRGHLFAPGQPDRLASTLLLRSPAPAKGYNVTVSTEHMYYYYSVQANVTGHGGNECSVAQVCNCPKSNLPGETV